MIDATELLFVVNEFDEPLEPRSRAEVITQRHWHRVAHVWIINDKYEVLCQKRSLRKDISPGMWEPFVAGHIQCTDTYFSGALKEVEEETGICAKKDDLHLVKIYKASSVNEYRAIFYLQWNGDISEVVSEAAEVDEVQWIPLKKVLTPVLDEKDQDWFHPGYAREMLSILALA